MSLKLTAAEAKDQLWKKLSAHFAERLERVRRDNDAPLDRDRTAALRGRIEELKYLLSLDKPAREIKSEQG